MRLLLLHVQGASAQRALPTHRSRQHRLRRMSGKQAHGASHRLLQEDCGRAKRTGKTAGIIAGFSRRSGKPPPDPDDRGSAHATLRDVGRVPPPTGGKGRVGGIAQGPHETAGPPGERREGHGLVASDAGGSRSARAGETTAEVEVEFHGTRVGRDGGSIEAVAPIHERDHGGNIPVLGRGMVRRDEKYTRPGPPNGCNHCRPSRRTI